MCQPSVEEESIPGRASHHMQEPPEGIQRVGLRRLPPPVFSTLASASESPRSCALASFPASRAAAVALGLAPFWHFAQRWAAARPFCACKEQLSFRRHGHRRRFLLDSRSVIVARRGVCRGGVRQGQGQKLEREVRQVRVGVCC